MNGMIAFFFFSSNVHVCHCKLHPRLFHIIPKKKNNLTLFFHTSFFSLCQTHLMLTNICGRCLGVRKTFLWSHTAFKRTCEAARIVKSLILKLHNLCCVVLLFDLIFQSALNRSSHQQWMCWTESWCCCLAKAFFLYILVSFCLFVVLLFHLPHRLLNSFTWNVLLLLLLFFLSDIIGCVQTSCASQSFWNIHFRFLSCVYLWKKDSPEPIWFFFLTRALKVWRSGS